MTTLHTGGKFGGGGYKVSGGLHGVGVSVVNALSARVVLEVDRGGKTYRQEYAAEKSGRGAVKPGVPQGKLKVVAQSKRGHTGTSVTFWPDPDVFEEVEFRYATIAERLQVMAFLNRGLTIALHDERPGHKQSETFKFDGGIVDFVRHLNQSKEPLFKDVGYFGDNGPEGEVEVAWQWNTGYHEGLHSFANGISTTEGGMHVEGFRRALTEAVNRYAKDRNLVKGKDAAFQGDDVREGLTAIVSVRLTDPQFEGQTKAQARQHRDAFARRARHEYALHPLARGAPESRRRRSSPRRRARRGRVRRPSRRAISPAARPRSTASACPTSSPTARRATATAPSSSSSKATPPGGSARDARDPKNQAILPLRGKILNVERASMDKVVANAEIQSLTAAIGGGIGADFDVAKVRYGRVIILADADVDGGHIRTLLITFFYRQMTPLVEHGRLYVAQPPLYSVEIGGEKQYIADDAARLRVMEEHPNRQLSLRPVQGSRRDGPARAARDVHGSRDASPRADRRRPGHDRRRRAVGADGRRRRGAPQLDPAQRQRRPLPRRVGNDLGSRPMARRKATNQMTLDVPPLRHPDADAAGRGRGRVPRVRDERHRAARAARRPRRAEAGATPHPLGDARREPASRSPVREVRARRRRGDGELPPARRHLDLRRARAHGSALLAHRAAHRQARQLRLALRSARGLPLHRVPAVAARDGAARRHRRRHRRLRTELRRFAQRARRAAGALPEPARERRAGHRGRYGHQHPAPQPRRGLQRGGEADRQARRDALAS